MASESPRIPRLLTIKEAAEATGIPTWRYYELLQQKKGPPFMKVGRTFRFSDSALAAWIRAEHEKAAAVEDAKAAK